MATRTNPQTPPGVVAAYLDTLAASRVPVARDAVPYLTTRYHMTTPAALTAIDYWLVTRSQARTRKTHEGQGDA
jgi:hypothetical protein